MRKLAVEIDQDELTVRLLEIGCEMKRPPGKSASEAMDEVRAMAARGEIPAHIVDNFEAMSVAAITYLGERMNALQEIQ